MHKKRTPGSSPSRTSKETTRGAVTGLGIDGNELLRALIGNMPDHIYAKDTRHRFVLCNDAVVRNMGAASEDEVIGKTDADFFPPNHVEQYLLDEKEIFESGKPMLNREEQVVDPDGNVHWALTSKVPIRNKSGTVVGLVGVNRDITELKRLRDKEQALMESLRRELALAENIQRGFLPRKLPQPEGWDLAAHYMPAYEVGGDFYDVFSLDSHTIAFWIGDVSGKSISAAILMSHTTTLLRAFAEHFHAESHNPLDVVENLNRHICSYHSHRGAERRFVTLFFGILHTKTGIINYVNAGHLPPYIASADRQLLRVAPTGPALGLTPDATYESATHQLQPGEVLFAYTDGVTEAQNTHGAFFSKNRLERILSEDLAHPRHYLDGVLDAVHEHTGGKVRSDDIAILALRRKVSAD